MKKGKTIVLRLVNGETIIAIVKSVTAKEYVLHRPYAFQTFVMGDGPKNAKELLFVRDWLNFSINNNISIDKSQVITHYKPDPSVLKLYHEKMEMDDTKSNIETSIMEEDVNDLTSLMDYLDDKMDTKGPINEDMVDNIIDMINSHNEEYYEDEEELTEIQPDDFDFQDDEVDKTDNPDEWGNHYKHWPVDPKDYF